jgi:hypothetical protein
MPTEIEAGPLDQILSLAHEIIDECPSCARKARRIAMWATEIRERRPDRAQVAALVGAGTAGLLPDAQLKALVDRLFILMRYPE